MLKQIQYIDDFVLDWIGRLHTPILNNIMIVISMLGTKGSVWIPCGNCNGSKFSCCDRYYFSFRRRTYKAYGMQNASVPQAGGRKAAYKTS